MNFSHAEVSEIVSVLCGTYKLTSPFVGVAVKRFGCRIVCIAGAVLSTIAVTSCVFAPNVRFIVIVYGFVAGIGLGMIFMPACTAGCYYFDKKRDFALAIMRSGSIIGSLVMNPLLAYVLHVSDSWKMLFIAFAVLFGSCIIFGALMKPVSVPKNDETTDETSGSSIANDEHHDNNLDLIPGDGITNILTNCWSSVKRQLKLQLLSDSVLLFIAMREFLYSTAIGSFHYFGFDLMLSKGLNEMEATFVMFGCNIACVISSLICSWICKLELVSANACSNLSIFISAFGYAVLPL